MKRAKNECFDCIGKWEKCHKCKGKLFLLSANGQFFSEYTEPIEEEDLFVDVVEEIRMEPTHISLHSLEGHISPRTLKLTTIINNCKISILLDSGSTHNFIQCEIAEYLRLPIFPIPSFLVSTGSGAHLRCDRMCK